MAERKTPTTVYLTPTQMFSLKEIKLRTGHSEASLIREGVDAVIKAYREHFEKVAPPKPTLVVRKS